MDNKIFTSPLFLSSVITLIVVIIVYFYNSHQEKKEDKEGKGGIYYFGLFVLVFCLSYGALYLYNNLTNNGPTEVAKKVLEGGKKMVEEIKPMESSNFVEPIVTKLQEQVEVLGEAMTPRLPVEVLTPPSTPNMTKGNVILEGAEDFISTGLPDW